MDEVKDVHDKAEAMRLYALKAKDMELVRWAAELKLDAERKGGQLLTVMEKAKGGQPYRSQHAIGRNGLVVPTEQSRKLRLWV